MVTKNIRHTKRISGGVTNVQKTLRISRGSTEGYNRRQSRQKKMWKNLQIEILRLRNTFNWNERVTFFFISSVSTKRVSAAYLGYWIAATDEVLIPLLIVLIVVTLFQHVILVTLSPILQLLAGTVLPKTKLANGCCSNTKRIKTTGWYRGAGNREI